MVGFLIRKSRKAHQELYSNSYKIMEKSMKKIFLNVVVSLVVAIPSVYAGANDFVLNKVNRGRHSHLLVVFDRAGLNNYSCSSLYTQNIGQFEKLFEKRNIKKLRVSSVTFLTFDERVNIIGTASEKNPNKTYRIAKELFEKTKDNMQFDTKGLAKDIIGSMKYILMLSQQYDSSDEIIILFFSNLRESIKSKKELQEMNKINLPNNVHLQIYSSSGLSCLVGTTTTSQALVAEQSYADFFKNKIDGDINIFTIYGGQ